MSHILSHHKLNLKIIKPLKTLSLLLLFYLYTADKIDGVASDIFICFGRRVATNKKRAINHPSTTNKESTWFVVGAGWQGRLFNLIRPNGAYVPSRHSSKLFSFEPPASTVWA